VAYTRFLSQSEVEQLVDAMPDKYKGMVLVGLHGPAGRSTGPQPVQSPGLAAGRHPCWDPQHHLPRPAAQLRGDPGRGWLQRPGGVGVGGHNSVAFTLTRYGGLFEDGSDAAVDRLDALLGGDSKDSDNVLQLDTRN
jgi:hypothetical protein